MNKLLPLLVIFCVSAEVSEDLCYQKGAEASHLFNQVMNDSVYEVTVVDNGDEEPLEVTIKVPLTYKSIPLMGVSVNLGGYNGFAADLATTTKNSSVYSAFYVAKSNLSKVSVLANYQTTETCEGIEITKEFISYNVPILYNKSKQQGPSAGTH